MFSWKGLQQPQIAAYHSRIIYELGLITRPGVKSAFGPHVSDGVETEPGS
jgi:hypothetical protein